MTREHLLRYALDR